MAHFDQFSDTQHFEVKQFAAEYSFRLREIESVEIRIRIWETKDSYGGSHFSFEQSHYLHTPIQAGPYMTSLPFGDSVEGALHCALMTFEGFIEPAKREGHTPSPKWLVPNESYASILSN